MEEGLRISPVSGEILRIGGFTPVLLDALLSIVVWEHRGMFGVLSDTGNLLGYGVPVSRKAGFFLGGTWSPCRGLGIESPRPPKKIPRPLTYFSGFRRNTADRGFAPVLLDALLSIVVWEHRGMFGVLSGTGNLLGAGVPVSRMAGAGYLVPCLGVVGARSPHKKNPAFRRRRGEKTCGED